MEVSIKGHPTRAVLYLAVASRVLVAALFLLWRNVANPYDTSADLSLPCLSSNSCTSQEEHQQPIWGQRLGKAIQRTVVWDGVYYIRIAECGYEYEQAYAFLPALPLLIRLMSQTIFYNLIPVLGLRPTLALSGYVIINLSFVLAAYYLYRLSKQVLEDEKQALVAVALFCFNPASTFYSAIYSESLFALFSFAGLWHFLNGARWTAIALFGLSSGVRSNGVLHAGFILFQAMHKAYDVAFCQKRLLEPTRFVSSRTLVVWKILHDLNPFLLFSCLLKLTPVPIFSVALALISHEWQRSLTGLCSMELVCQEHVQAVVPIILVALFQSAGVVTPYVAFQRYGFIQLCLHEGIPETRPWCSKTIPHLYSFVQSYYWNVGFLRYFQFKQLPNFVLASPMLCLAVCGIVTYARNQPRLFFLLGLAASPSTRARVALMPPSDSKAAVTFDQQGLKPMVAIELTSNSLNDTEKLRNRKGSKRIPGTSDLEAEPLKQTGFNSLGSICFLIQLGVMVATAVFVMHVQVATRFLSVSPPVYWYGAYLMNHSKKQELRCIMWTVFFSYIGLGSLLFINFYPFT